jgi:hypothetical protein
MRRTRLPLGILTVLCLTLGTAVFAAGPPVYQLTITDQSFMPATLDIPVGTRVELRVRNSRSLPSEFESFELNREKVVPPGSTVTVWIGPLPAGRYKAFDDFHPGPICWVIVRTLGRQQ